MTTITHDGYSIPLAPPKDPDSKADYGFDWTLFLDTANTETISTSVWILDAALTEVSSNIDTYITTCLMTGGVTGHNYTITNRITTSVGRIEDRSMRFQAKPL